MAVETWSLRVLVEVADQGSLSRAAERLLLSQPAVSRQIAKLERQLGAPLMRRSTRGIELTAAGATAVDLARGVVARVDALEASVRSLTGEVAGPLRVCGFPGVNGALLPDAVIRLQADHPSVEATIERVDPFDALGAVRDGRIDVALVTGWQLVADPEVARTDLDAATLDRVDGVDLVPLVDEALLVVLPRSHRLARRRSVPLAQLGDERWIEGSYPDCLGPVPQLAAALGGEPRVASWCDDWSGKQALVAGGAGVMLAAELAARTLRPDLVARATEPALPPRPLAVAVAPTRYRIPAAQALVDILRELTGADDDTAATR